MALREGAWDCPFCGKKRNRGPEKFCGGCGSARGPEVKFYLPEDARVVEDAAEVERAHAGPDWTCPFCSGDNKGWNAFCTGCGSAREGGAARAVVQHATAPRTAEEAASLPSATGSATPPPGAPEPVPEAPAPPNKATGRTALTCLGGCGAVFGLFLLLIMFLAGTHEEKVQVAAAHWERAISIERQVPERHEAWRDQVPAGARELSRRQDVRSHRKIQTGTETRTRTVTKQVPDGTEKVKVGTKDLGNGYFEDVFETRTRYRTEEREETYQEAVYREEPVYDTKVAYEVLSWKEGRQARASGEDTAPRWPDLTLAAGEREGSRTERYTLTVKDAKGKTYEFQPKDSLAFEAFRVGSSYSARINRMGTVTELKG